MLAYQNLGRNSSVESYTIRQVRIGRTSIRVKFTNGESYRYTYASAGKKNVETMKSLARAGIGLNSFIKKHADKLYASRT